MFLSVAMITLVVFLCWVFQLELARFAGRHPAFYIASITFIAFVCIAIAGVLWIEDWHLRRIWLTRVAADLGLAGLGPEPLWQSFLGRFPDPLELLLDPIWHTRIGKNLYEDWIDAGLGARASRYVLLLLVVASAGYFIGMRIGGPVLGVALGLVAPLLPRSLVSSRAEAGRRRFSEQLPQALDSISSGLAAGLSFQQAVEYAQEDLPDPARSAFDKLSRRIVLGFPVDQSLQRILEDHPDESLALVVDGLVLQRKFGGDMVRMLEDIAGVLRERLELEREVRAVTTQGRLSGIIIAALMPVSAGFLLSFNPRYVDVLFDTLIGQVLVVVAMILQLIGWVVISRLVQVRY
ncbi:MAG: type II secretion system F family protein [Anaerolineales bacterium]